MPELQEWMLDASNWHRVSGLGEGWEVLGWFAFRNPNGHTTEQLDNLDFTSAVLLQKNTGWN